MSWEDDADLNEAYLRANPAPPPKERDRPFDVKRGLMEDALGRVSKVKSGLAEMKKQYEQKTGQSGEFEHGPMALVRKLTLGKGKKKTRRASTSKRWRGRSRRAGAGSRKGKSS